MSEPTTACAGDPSNPLNLRDDVDAYYVPIDDSRFEPTLHVQGAWLPHEQHMAPVAGLITHCLQTHNPREDLQIARLTFEILGVMPAARTTVECSTIRSGRTIELDEATLSIDGTVAVRARAWRLARVDTAAVADALRDKRIFAVALDVYENEPTPPAPLLSFDNAVLTPHIGGISPQAIHASVLRFLENADAHFAGRPLITPVP